MKKLTTSIVFIGSVLISGCYSQGGWTPTVDSYNDPNAYRINQDMAECKDLGGAALGAIAGSPGTGAAIGATVGGLGGGAKQGFEGESTFKRAYTNCMRNRRHNIVN
jgi:outer membrane lipoprotein SlyB